jgi:predicted DsbA family dithiol-disulfide isomerase
MPNDKYYSFISLLFSSIEQWAPKFQDSLIQYATLAGLPTDKARACLNDTDLETALIQGVRDASQQHQITATPTFSFNDGKKIIQGARPYIEFQMAIDGLIEEAKDAAKAK